MSLRQAITPPGLFARATAARRLPMFAMQTAGAALGGLLGTVIGLRATMLIGALGLFWVLARALGAPLFARPLWLYFTFIALIAVLAYHAYYWRRRYPVEISAYEQQIRRRRWLPTPRKRAAARRR